MAGDLVISTINGGAIGTKNVIIDGNFNVNQRGVSGTVTLAAGAYGHDRWKGGASGATYTFATVENVTTLTISAGSLIQVIEGLNLQSGTYTLSFSGTAQGKIGAGSFSSSGVTGTATGGTNLNIEFNTGTLSLVQLEKGSTATAFDYRPYGTELVLCQRYFFKMLGTSSYEKPSANGYYTSSTVGIFIFAIPIQMRTSPTLTTSNLTTYPMNTLVGNMPITSFYVDQTSLNTPSYSFTVASGGTIGAWTGLQTQGSTAAYLWFSSEL